MTISGQKSQTFGNSPHTIPFPKNPLFTGREDFLKKLHDTLADPKRKKFGHRVAIYGMAGVGKTEVAVEYVHRFRAEYERVYWIPSVDQASLLAGYQDIALKDCRIEVAGMDPIDLAHYVIRWLGRQKSWLVVLDNLDEISVVENRLLPVNGPKTHTLITTRNPTPELLPLLAEGVQVPVLDHADAVILLSIYANIAYQPMTADGWAADELVQSLGYLPLAIQQAGSYVREVAKSFVTYQQEYNRALRRQIERTPYGNNRYLTTVSATWSLAFNYIYSSNRQVARLLQLLSFLSPGGVLREFLVEGSAALDSDLRYVVSSRPELTAALSMLKKFSLVKSNSTNKLWTIHRLIQAALRDEMPTGEREAMFTCVINFCNLTFPEPDDQTRERCRRFQTQVVEPLLTITSVHTPASVTIKRRVGNFLREDGKLRESHKMLQQALVSSQSYFGFDHPETLMTMQSLALTYTSLGDDFLDEAYEMQQKVFTAYQKSSRQNDPSLSSAMSVMAKICEAQSDLESAVKWLEQVLKRDRLIFGPDSDKLVPTLSNIARLYAAVGEGRKAIESEEQVVRIRTKRDAEAPDTFIAINNLALTLQEQGQPKRGESLLVEVLRKLGARNRPEMRDVTVMTMGNLALMYTGQERYKEAMFLEEKVYEKNMKELGPDHDYTLTAMTNLALTYGDQGRTNESIELFKQIVERQRRVNGEDDPDTLKATVDLAIANMQVGNLVETCRLQTEVLRKMEAILGEEHPLTLNTMDNLAVTYYEMGNDNKGDELKRRVGDLRLRGRSHRSSV